MLVCEIFLSTLFTHMLYVCGHIFVQPVYWNHFCRKEYSMHAFQDCTDVSNHQKPFQYITYAIFYNYTQKEKRNIRKTANA